MADAGGGLLAERHRQVGEVARGAGTRSGPPCATRGSGPGRARWCGRAASSAPLAGRRAAASRRRASGRGRRARASTSATSATGRPGTTPAALNAAPAAAATGSSAGRRGPAGGSRPRGVVGQLGQELVQERLDVAHAHEREERARGGGLVGVARDLDGQRREPERPPEDALDDADRAHARDRHRRLAALDQPAPDPQPVAVADEREAAEGHERAERSRAARPARAARRRRARSR